MPSLVNVSGRGEPVVGNRQIRRLSTMERYLCVEFLSLENYASIELGAVVIDILLDLRKRKRNC